MKLLVVEPRGGLLVVLRAKAPEQALRDALRDGRPFVWGVGERIYHKGDKAPAPIQLFLRFSK